jgi:hypothetical protein
MERDLGLLGVNDLEREFHGSSARRLATLAVL